jgi:hypothetical protein
LLLHSSTSTTSSSSILSWNHRAYVLPPPGTKEMEQRVPLWFLFRFHDRSSASIDSRTQVPACYQLSCCLCSAVSSNQITTHAWCTATRRSKSFPFHSSLHHWEPACMHARPSIYQSRPINHLQNYFFLFSFLMLIFQGKVSTLPMHACMHACNPSLMNHPVIGYLRLADQAISVSQLFLSSSFTTKPRSIFLVINRRLMHQHMDFRPFLCIIKEKQPYFMGPMMSTPTYLTKYGDFIWFYLYTTLIYKS